MEIEMLNHTVADFFHLSTGAFEIDHWLNCVAFTMWRQRETSESITLVRHALRMQLTLLQRNVS